MFITFAILAVSILPAAYCDTPGMSCASASTSIHRACLRRRPRALEKETGRRSRGPNTDGTTRSTGTPPTKTSMWTSPTPHRPEAAPHLLYCRVHHTPDYRACAVRFFLLCTSSIALNLYLYQAAHSALPATGSSGFYLVPYVPAASTRLALVLGLELWPTARQIALTATGAGRNKSNLQKKHGQENVGLMVCFRRNCGILRIALTAPPPVQDKKP